MHLSLRLIAIYAIASCCHPQSINASAAVSSSGRANAESGPANAEMHDLFMADQAIRMEVERRGGWKVVKDDKDFLERWESEDLIRLQRTKELLEINVLTAGVDFYHAAFILQHSETAEDFLKAHHLSVIAISKGYDARWISAATLDRYLQAIGKKQIYGTQYRANEAGEYVRQPVEPAVVTDAERIHLNVPALKNEKE